MSIEFPGFCGPSYQLTNRYAAIERTVNYFLQPNESPEESKFKTLLVPTPGNAPFSQLPVPAPFNQWNRALIELRGQVYGVNGTAVFSLSPAGVYSSIGTVIDDGVPATMVANGNGQIFIAAAGNGYVIQQDGSFVTLGGGGLLGANAATFQDGYIIVVKPNSNILQISGNDDTPVGDATLWSAANISVQAGQADLLSSVISRREYLRLFGERRSQIYYNVGPNGIGGFPFQSYNETFIETGLDAVFSVADLGDSLIWIGRDERGMRACWRDQAFQPQRVSTFAVEQFWQGYSRVDDARAFSCIWNGRLLYQITFPSANTNQATGQKLGTTWVYDVTASSLMGRQIWTERAFQSALGYSTCRAEQTHCYAYGLHLVGSAGEDGNPGAVYQYSNSQFTDCGLSLAGAQVQQPIVRDRIAPHLYQGNKRIIYDRLELELSRGVGLDGAPPVGVDPQMYMRISRDGGNTWGVEYNMPVGKMGQYNQRVRLNRLGYAYDGAFWSRYSDPTYMSIVSAQLDIRVCG